MYNSTTCVNVIQGVCRASVMVTAMSLSAYVTMRQEFVTVHTTHMVITVNSVKMATMVIHG